jgi:predicted RNA-binding Zn ribbon-like protein
MVSAPAMRMAPGELELVRSFVNTLDRETGDDALGEPRALADWLAEHELLDPGTRATGVELRRAMAVREALRALLVANNGGPLDPDAVAVLEAAVPWCGLVVVFDHRGRIAVEPTRPGVGGAVGRLLAASSRAMSQGTWNRLKACRANDCGWAFYDWSRNRSGRWCSMAVCGNRAKVRALRARRSTR